MGLSSWRGVRWRKVGGLEGYKRSALVQPIYPNEAEFGTSQRAITTMTPPHTAEQRSEP